VKRGKIIGKIMGQIGGEEDERIGQGPGAPRLLGGLARIRKRGGLIIEAPQDLLVPFLEFLLRQLLFEGQFRHLISM
jgi:hypothetical protein